MGAVTLAIQDYSGEKQQFSLPTVDFTAGNFVATNGLIDNFVAAALAVCSGTMAADVREAYRTTSNTLPVTAAAQIEVGWAVKYQDSTTKKNYLMRIPAPDIEDETLFVPNSNVADLTNAEWVTFKSAWAAVIKSPDGNATVVKEVKLIGKGVRLTPKTFAAIA